MDNADITAVMLEEAVPMSGSVDIDINVDVKIRVITNTVYMRKGSKVTFKIPKVLPVDSYLVEVVAGGYVFPSDQNVRVDVIQSADEYTSEQVLELVKNDVKAEIGKFIEAHKESGITEEFPDLTTLYNLAKI